MVYAIVQNGVVVNTVVSNFAVNDSWIPTGNIHVRIGDTYNGDSFFHNDTRVLTEVELLRKENAELSEYAEVARILLGEE